MLTFYDFAMAAGLKHFLDARKPRRPSREEAFARRVQKGAPIRPA